MPNEQELIDRLHKRLQAWEADLHWKTPARQNIIFTLYQYGDGRSAVAASVHATSLESGNGWEMRFDADLRSLYFTAEKAVGPRPGYPWDGGFGHLVKPYDDKVSEALVEIFADRAIRSFDASLLRQGFVHPHG